MAGKFLTCPNCKSPVGRNETGMLGVSVRICKRSYGTYKYYIVKVAGDYVGSFTDLEKAARAYDAEARSRYGECAKLNYPD